MADNTNFPAISRQVTELVLAGSSDHAEEAINDTAEQFGDLAVVAVLDTLEPQVAAMHLSAFDGGKLSLATLLISPKAWAESLAYFAAIWSDDMIEDEPEVLTESLFAHVHGVIFSSDEAERRAALIHEALSTDCGTTAFAVLFSTAIGEIIELANDIHSRGAHSSGQTTSDHDVIPLALEIARSDSDAWDRVLFEIFPDWQPGENQLRARSEEDDDDEVNHDYALARTTHDLLLRLRRQVPSKSVSTPKKGARPSLGEDIFA
ncbi:MAG: hypothetical protein M0P59_15060 [Gallionella sp.]|jgi:hypothetical protein|nr:hypothetical protein [Gallionella sp.]MCK9355449.1 hypothetical protein [Gallionella sp.]